MFRFKKFENWLRFVYFRVFYNSGTFIVSMNIDTYVMLSSDSVSGRFGRIPGQWLFGKFKGFFKKRVFIKKLKPIKFAYV